MKASRNSETRRRPEFSDEPRAALEAAGLCSVSLRSRLPLSAVWGVCEPRRPFVFLSFLGLVLPRPSD